MRLGIPKRSPAAATADSDSKRTNLKETEATTPQSGTLQPARSSPAGSPPPAALPTAQKLRLDSLHPTYHVLFPVTIFLSAFLLFQVQPMIGRYVLPWFGGGPAVWSTCLLFFQASLLAGYAYAHWLGSLASIRLQAGIHSGLLLAVAVGGPYLLLSATAPLVQRWFTMDNPEKSPWRLYALSNFGSFLAL